MAVDVEAMRKAYADQMANQRKLALRGVQDIYAGRGTTGGGSEAVAMGETANQFGLGAGMAEVGLQQYLGNLEMQQQQFDWTKNLGLANMYNQGTLQQNPLAGVAGFEGLQGSQEWEAAQRAGFQNPYEQSMYMADPEKYKQMYGSFTPGYLTGGAGQNARMSFTDYMKTPAYAKEMEGVPNDFNSKIKKMLDIAARYASGRRQEIGFI